ncbi:MAG: DNA repair protein RecN [Candidatus Dormibacteria bacterium]
MLLELRVEDLAVIESSCARFGPRFNSVTGETGAGKSVLLAALGLTLGGRADPDLVRRGAERARCSAVFEELPVAAVELCAGLGLEAGEGLVLVRELAASGRSGARANGAALPASALRELGGGLVDVQGQGASTIWLREADQRAALDSLGGAPAAARLARIAELFTQRETASARIAELRSLRSRRDEELERARQDLAELTAAELVSGEDVRLRHDRDRLAHSARLREAASALRAAVAGGGAEVGAADRVAEALHRSRGAREVDAQLDTLLDQVEAAVGTLRELQLAFSSYVSQLPDDRRQLAEIEERLELLGRLARRHGGSLEAAVQRRLQASALLLAVDQGEGELERLVGEQSVRERELAGEAARLSELRGRAARDLARSVTADLRRMLMPKAEFRVVIWQLEDPSGVAAGEGPRLGISPSGWDRVCFELAANPGDLLRPLTEVASGGELSRVALALLSHLTRESGVGTVVFDEIDQGLGGEAANRVGELMREVAEHHQVICITHLAPIAARADTHLLVAKSERAGRPHSEVAQIEGPERVRELARLLAGEATPGAAQKHAVELLAAVGNAREPG